MVTASIYLFLSRNICSHRKKERIRCFPTSLYSAVIKRLRPLFHVTSHTKFLMGSGHFGSQLLLVEAATSCYQLLDVLSSQV